MEVGRGDSSSQRAAAWSGETAFPKGPREGCSEEEEAAGWGVRGDQWVVSREGRWVGSWAGREGLGLSGFSP